MCCQTIDEEAAEEEEELDEAKDDDGDDDDEDAGKWWFHRIRECLMAFNITPTNQAIYRLISFFAHFKMVTMMMTTTVMSPHQRNKDKVRRLVFLIYTENREILLRGPPMVVMAQWFPHAISIVAAITVGPRKPSFLAHRTLFSLLVGLFFVEKPTVWRTCTIECVCQVDTPLVAFG